MAYQEPNQGATGSVSAEDTQTTAASAANPGPSPFSVGSQGDAFDERPELFVAGAFVGGLVVAQILRRVGS